jgi:DNA primase
LFCDNNIDENSKKDILFLSYLRHSANTDYQIDKINIDKRPCSYFSLPEPDGGGPFSSDILNFFAAEKCYTDDFGIDRALIPIYDENNILAGYSGRAMEKVKHRKYLLTDNMVAGDILYNLNNAKKTLSDYIIIVEGYKAVWRLHEYGYDNVACCMGSLVTPHQIRLLIQTLKKVVLFLDPDSPGIQGTIITNNKYSSMIPIIPIISEFDRDPADLTKEEADKLLIKYKSKKQSYV